MENLLKENIFVIERKCPKFFEKKYIIENQLNLEDNLYAFPSFAGLFDSKIDIYNEENKVNILFSVEKKLFKPCEIKDSLGKVIGYIKEKNSLFGGNYWLEDANKKKLAFLESYGWSNLKNNQSVWQEQYYCFDLIKDSETIGEFTVEKTLTTFKIIVNLSQDLKRFIDKRMAIGLAFLLEGVASRWSPWIGS